MLGVNIPKLFDLLNHLKSRDDLAKKLQNENEELHLNNAMLKTELDKVLQIRLNVGQSKTSLHKWASLVNRLANIIIDSAGKGYVSENELDEANDAIQKVVDCL